VFRLRDQVNGGTLAESRASTDPSRSTNPRLHNSLQSARAILEAMQIRQPEEQKRTEREEAKKGNREEKEKGRLVELEDQIRRLNWSAEEVDERKKLEERASAIREKEQREGNGKTSTRERFQNDEENVRRAKPKCDRRAT
jgi:hypothetical protein